MNKLQELRNKRHEVGTGQGLSGRKGGEDGLASAKTRLPTKRWNKRLSISGNRPSGAPAGYGHEALAGDQPSRGHRPDD